MGKSVNGLLKTDRSNSQDMFTDSPKLNRTCFYFCRVSQTYNWVVKSSKYSKSPSKEYCAILNVSLFTNFCCLLSTETEAFS